MSAEQAHPAGGAQDKPGWLSNRRTLIKTATGIAAAGVVGGVIADTAGTAAAASVGSGPVVGGQATRDAVIIGSPEYFVTIQGAKQGKFKGDYPNQPNNVKIKGYGWHYDLTIPHDAASGLPTGKRQHKPVVITKEWGPSTPQLFTAAVSNETLSQITFSFFENSPQGAARVQFTIKLTNASIASIEQYVNFNADGHANANEAQELEDVAFTFQKIEWTWTDGGITASDDWESPAT